MEQLYLQERVDYESPIMPNSNGYLPYQDGLKKRQKWETAEDIKLVQLRQQEYKWETIAKQLNDRTTGAAKKRFMVLQKEHGRGFQNMINGIKLDAQLGRSVDDVQGKAGAETYGTAPSTLSEDEFADCYVQNRPNFGVVRPYASADGCSSMTDTQIPACAVEQVSSSQQQSFQSSNPVANFTGRPMSAGVPYRPDYTSQAEQISLQFNLGSSTAVTASPAVPTLENDIFSTPNPIPSNKHDQIVNALKNARSRASQLNRMSDMGNSTTKPVEVVQLQATTCCRTKPNIDTTQQNDFSGCNQVVQTDNFSGRTQAQSDNNLGYFARVSQPEGQRVPSLTSLMTRSLIGKICNTVSNSGNQNVQHIDGRDRQGEVQGEAEQARQLLSVLVQRAAELKQVTPTDLHKQLVNDLGVMCLNQLLATLQSDQQEQGNDQRQEQYLQQHGALRQQNQQPQHQQTINISNVVKKEANIPQMESARSFSFNPNNSILQTINQSVLAQHGNVKKVTEQSVIHDSTCASQQTSYTSLQAFVKPCDQSAVNTPQSQPTDHAVDNTIPIKTQNQVDSIDVRIADCNGKSILASIINDRVPGISQIKQESVIDQFVNENDDEQVQQAKRTQLRSVLEWISGHENLSLEATARKQEVRGEEDIQDSKRCKPSPQRLQVIQPNDSRWKRCIRSLSADGQNEDNYSNIHISSDKEML